MLFRYDPAEGALSLSAEFKSKTECGKSSVQSLLCSSSTFLKDVVFKVCVMVHKNTVAADLILVAIGTKLEQMLSSVLEK